MKDKVLVLIIMILVALSGVCFVHSKLSENKDMKEYSIGLSYYKSEDWQKAYRHFSKISIFSDIKTPALFRQARCATLLGDTRAAKRNYRLLLFIYPNSQLYVVSEYNLAMLMYDLGEKSARKHFVHIIKYFPKTDYALASEYYVASIDMEAAKHTKFYWKRTDLKHKALNHFIRYVKLSPDGRFVQSSINKISKLGIAITDEDSFAIADSYFKRELYDEADKYYSDSPLKYSWAKYAKTEFKRGNTDVAKAILETGLGKYSSYVDKQDMYDAIDENMKLSTDKLSTANYLYNKFSQSKCADYLLYLKAKNSDNSQKYTIYEKLYDKYPDSNFSAEALYETFYSQIDKKQYDKALRLGQKHISHFKKSDTSPAVLFWMGKIYERKNKPHISKRYYKMIPERYPDSYYSYRAYSKLNKGREIFIDTNIKEKPIVFPCVNRKEQDMAGKLIELGDYDFISELYKDDKFVQSWIAHKQGKQVQSVIVAHKAMQEIYPKPKFDDVRWRLVYPLNYYKYIDKYKGDQDPFIILSIIREESHFNPEITSPVGAIGLMQLMPSTANEIAYNHGISNDLSSPENNIRLGCIYYSGIKNSLEGKDIYAVLAYNGGWGSVLSWKNNLNYADIDDFVEKIPYLETQSYVKKVLRSYWCYSNIY